MTANLQIEVNPQFAQALELIEETGANVFVTGRAGTGKSTLLNYFRTQTKKRIVVLAPTGVAALNVEGQTIHSFFGFKPDVNLSKVRKLSKRDEHRAEVYKKCDVLIIDEISMVRADLLDCVDKFMRLNGHRSDLPFGGVQTIFIGDLYQLPPVVTGAEKAIFQETYRSPFFFDAKLFESGFEMELIELEKIYRQRDRKLIDVLNAIRNNSATEADLAVLNKKCDPGFEPEADDLYIYLTTTNARAAEVNDVQLDRLSTDAFMLNGVVRGDFDQKSLPTDTSLKLKRGAQVMLLNNDSLGRWVNGHIGKIIDLYEEDEFTIDVELTDGSTVAVTPYTWTLFNFSFDKESNGIVSEEVGSFKQMPMKLAWAITVHKGQGKTFEKVIFDIGRGSFAHGQTYVALSRCTDLDGLVLKRPLKKSHILMDWKVVDFLTRYQYGLSERDLPLDDKVRILKAAATNKDTLEITYLKSGDEKSHRKITPLFVEEMEYMGTKFLGLKAFCALRGQERIFRVDRILEIKGGSIDELEKDVAGNSRPA